MSKGRMHDLLRTLESDNWILSNPSVMFLIENEVVRWDLENPLIQASIRIDFHLFGELGQKSQSLMDIHYCLVRDHGIKIYFEKRESPEWKHSLVDFMGQLRLLFSR